MKQYKQQSFGTIKSVTKVTSLSSLLIQQINKHLHEHYRLHMDMPGAVLPEEGERILKERSLAALSIRMLAGASPLDACAAATGSNLSHCGISNLSVISSRLQ
jgi:hypothetical protein